MGPPEELVLLLKHALNASTFVETGTFKGETALWAASHFDRVFTIENSKTLFDEATGNHKRHQNIEFLFGDSRAVLNRIVPEIHEPAVFWLDAHWCGMNSYGSDDQCPIMEEIGSIRSANIDHCILIDDARLFLSPPPFPNVIEQWPTIDSICSRIRSEDKSYYIVVFEDVIVAAPNGARSLVADYCQISNTRAWNQGGMPSAQDGLHLIKRGVWAVARDARLNVKRVFRSHGVAI
jgi:hypothetical protein